MHARQRCPAGSSTQVHAWSGLQNPSFEHPGAQKAAPIDATQAYCGPPHASFAVHGAHVTGGIIVGPASPKEGMLEVAAASAASSAGRDEASGDTWPPQARSPSAVRRRRASRRKRMAQCTLVVAARTRAPSEPA